MPNKQRMEAVDEEFSGAEVKEGQEVNKALEKEYIMQNNSSTYVKSLSQCNKGKACH